MTVIRALTIALWCVSASALSPLAAAGDDSDCALYLSGPGRSSAYDYSLNLLKGNFGYEGQNTCITYDAINQAYVEARNRILVAQPKGDWKPEDYASVGELVLDISINLARRYGLTYEEVEKGLPLIDTSRTLIREVCPPVFSHVECRAGKYRRLDGLCNNLQNPTWGATNAPFQRLIGPLFSDGINAPRISHTGRDLPLSRVVSRTMHPDDGFHDHAGTVMVIAWGQFMDHDYTLTGTPLDPLNRNDPEECCKRPQHLKHPYCNEIRIPDDDYFYRLFGVKCIDFVRAFPSPRPGCRLGSRIAYNTLTGAIDGNTVYGVTDKFSRKLRTGFGGLLRMNPVFKEYGLKDLLPLKLDIPDEGCTRPNKNMYCFEAGEIRVNEQLILTVMHTLMAREHNRVAQALSEVNPHWDDETLYQEARRINIAEIQHITYNEFLPILLGKDVMEKFGLVLEKEGYWDGYDQKVNPDVIASFAAAAYRFGHSLLPTAVERWSKAHKFIASKRLSDLIRRPYDLYRAGVIDEYVMGLMNQVAQAMDDSITQEVTNHLFKKVGARFGMDLVSFNMQRGREFGLPGYMEFRKFCGLPGADSFQDLFGSMSNSTVRKYETIFEHPVDVDLWSGGVSERPLPGSMLGPTFACIIATQFSYSRRGDRFWFELPNQPSSFTREQLAEIRKSRLSRIICDNTDIIDTVQLYPMVLPDHELNPRVPCRSGIIPGMDFSKWAEPAPFHGHAKQYITDALITANSNNGTEQHEERINTNNNITDTDIKCEELKSTINQNVDCNCNPTDQDAHSQKQDCDSNLYPESKNDSSSHPKDCAHDNEIVTDNCQNHTKNEIPNSDTILKYVYKKTDKADKQKSKGHSKNSLKRRKRSIKNKTIDEFANTDEKPPLIIDYETSHGPRDIEIVAPPRILDKSIKAADLADFNIETLHDSEPKDEGENLYRDNNQVKDKSEKHYGDNVKDIDRETHKNIEGNRQSTEESQETNNASDESEEFSKEGNNRKYNSNRGTYRESIRKPDFTDTDSSESLEGSEENKERKNGPYSKNINSKDSLESNERDVEIENSSEYSKNRDQSEEVVERNRPLGDAKSGHESEQLNKPHSRNDRQQTQLQDSIENNSESIEDDIPQRRTHDDYQNQSKVNKSSKVPIQDVDLDDFSYERIQVNKNGEVEVAKDNQETIDFTAPTSNPNTLKSNTKLEKYDKLNSLPSKEESSSSVERSDESVELVNINDGETKPVVELNSDSNSDELNDEAIKEPLRADLNDDDQSLETLLGVTDTDKSDQDDKIVTPKPAQNDENVKQEFERIPLDYKHNSKDLKTQNENEASINPEYKKIYVNEDAGTLDTFLPKEEKYDEHLNIKFDDLTLKLPEIKLPDDILSYAYEKPDYGSEKKKGSHKQPFYHYNKEDSEENQEEENKDTDKDEHDHDYDRYYGARQEKEDYKKPKTEDDDIEDEDLYEKFVRERFGKRGSFEKRSEKLQDIRSKPVNPQLYDALKGILKKTEEVQKEAEKSGDPKAGYLWTLEYGENA